jgi:F-box and leucine-rich repeat protein 2/20
MVPWDLSVWREIMSAMHELRYLQTLALDGSRELTDEVLHFYFHGTQQIDVEEQFAVDEIVKPLPIRQLVLSRLPRLTDRTLRNMAHATPHLRRLELAGTNQGTTFTITGTSILFPTTPNLTHLDFEDNPFVNDNTLSTISRLAMAKQLQHLCLSSCVGVSDGGLRHILQHCVRLRNLEVDNTQTGNTTLIEAPRWVLRRAGKGLPLNLRLVVYDCPSVTWVGVSEILQHNQQQAKDYVHERDVPLIRLKCCYDMQNIIDAHYRRCLRGEFSAAQQIQMGFSRYMLEEAEDGLWSRMRRRRRRGALDPGEMGEMGRRRVRAFSSPTSTCSVM